MPDVAQSLYQKYRPTTFAELIGNDRIVTELKGILARRDAGKPHAHALLFHGPTGCGKTTLAYVFAREIGCDFEFDLEELPCGIEGGVDAMRHISRDNLYVPMGNTVKVVLLDECHLLTKRAQGGLLSVLERERPRPVYFLLTTTEPATLLPTLVGRCSTFEVEMLDLKDTGRLLRRVAKKEGRSEVVTAELIDSIYAATNGHPRNILGKLETKL